MSRFSIEEQRYLELTVVESVTERNDFATRCAARCHVPNSPCAEKIESLKYFLGMAVLRAPSEDKLCEFD